MVSISSCISQIRGYILQVISNIPSYLNLRVVAVATGVIALAALAYKYGSPSLTKLTSWIQDRLDTTASKIQKMIVVEVGSGKIRIQAAEVKVYEDGRRSKVINKLYERSIDQITWTLDNSKDLDKQKVKDNLLEIDLQVEWALTNFYYRSDIQLGCFGTAVFRGAENSDIFFNRINEIATTNRITLAAARILTEEEEGEVGFHEIANACGSSIDRKKVITWDGGNGSFQISRLNDKGEVVTFSKKLGNSQIKDKIKELLSDKRLDQINLDQMIGNLRAVFVDRIQDKSYSSLVQLIKERTVVRKNGGLVEKMYPGANKEITLDLANKVLEAQILEAQRIFKTHSDDWSQYTKTVVRKGQQGFEESYDSICDKIAIRAASFFTMENFGMTTVKLTEAETATGNTTALLEQSSLWRTV